MHIFCGFLSGFLFESVNRFQTQNVILFEQKFEWTKNKMIIVSKVKKTRLIRAKNMLLSQPQ